MSPKTWKDMAALLDYANLNVDSQEKDLRLLCLQAEKYQIPTVLVNPGNVKIMKKISKGMNIEIASAVSYPVGAYFPEVKAQEIEDAIDDGADQIYMIMAVGAFIDGWLEQQTIPEFNYLVEKADGRPTKLVTEISVLDTDQRRKVCDLAIESGIDFLVTTTDFERSNLPPVTLKDIEFLVDYVQEDLLVIHKSKFNNSEQAIASLNAGATRVCTENALGILSTFEDFPWA
jgi:deoxyribose-phosphate aldolase